MKQTDLGRLVVTRAVDELMQSNPQFSHFVKLCLGRYLAEDWGKLPEEDKKSNDEAVKSGERILAAYPLPEGLTGRNMFGGTEERIWIITEWDRNVTTVLFPGEY
jgi:hypothetical protein